MKGKVVQDKQYTYTVVLERDELGGYVVSCPALPGLVTEGETVEEALVMAREAIVGYLESLAKDNLPIPEEYQSIVSPLTVSIPVAV